MTIILICMDETCFNDFQQQSTIKGLASAMNHTLLRILFLLTCCHSALAAEYEIKMLDRGEGDHQMVFEPAVLKVNVGDVVTFIPTGNAHDSISIFSPEGANHWHGKRDQKVSVTINKEGVYIYKCAPHFYVGMVGVIQAGEASNLEQAKQFANKINRQFIANKDRLINYLDKIEQ